MYMKEIDYFMIFYFNIFCLINISRKVIYLKGILLKTYCLILSKMGHEATKPVIGVSDKAVFKSMSSATENS